MITKRDSTIFVGTVVHAQGLFSIEAEALAKNGCPLCVHPMSQSATASYFYKAVYTQTIRKVFLCLAEVKERVYNVEHACLLLDFALLEFG
jgi:hypothetical protein